MTDITITETHGNRIAVHAPSSLIDQLAAAYQRMKCPVAYDVFRAEDGADLLTTRADFDTVMAAHPALRAQIERDIVDDIQPHIVMVAGRRP